MTRPLLAAALIVKDEERSLPECFAALARLSGLVDEIVVYDTGSTDRTRELAQEAGARVEQGFWDGDFSRARNAAIAATTAAWVLIVDADERVVADPERLAAALRAARTADAFVVPLVNIAPDGEELYAAPQIRIFRRDRAHYAGKVHERVEPRRPGAGPLRTEDLVRDVVHVRHVGYVDPQVVRAKAERNLELAAAEVDRLLAGPEPDPAALARALYHRGRTLVSAGRISEALADLERLRELPVRASERTWGGDVLAQLLLAMGRLDHLAELVEDLRTEGVDAQYCDWLLARALLAQERYAEALPLLRGIDVLTDAVGRVLDPIPVVEAQMIAAGRVGEVDEAAACCIRLMAGYGRTEGLGSLLLTLWGSRPSQWLVDLLQGAAGGDDDSAHLAATAAELAGCPEPGPAIAAALSR